MLGASSSQSTVPIHELPPARLVIRRQTSAHEHREGTREGSAEVTLSRIISIVESIIGSK